VTVPMVTASMIVRDEARYLDACLASIEGVVDEIVVVDTGSLDTSPEIARSHGARVFHHTWEDNFSQARNLALEHSTGRWILYIDADERLRPTSRDDLATLLEGAEEAAFRLLLHPFAHSTPYLEYRLWRNDPRVRFRGTIHEKIVDAIVEVADVEGRSIGDCTLTLDHVGYDGDQAAKHQRNLPLLQAQLRIDDNNVFNWRHLARVLDALGRADEADQAVERAVDIVRAAPGSADDSLAWVDLVRRRDRRGDDVMALVAEGRRRWPDNWLLVWTEGQLLVRAGRFHEAIPAFQQLLAVDVGGLAPTGLAYDDRIFGPFAQDSLGLCWFRLGNFGAAARAYGAAEALAPAVAEYRVKRLLAEGRAASRGLIAPGF